MQVLSTPTTTDGVSQQLLSVAADGLILFWDVRVKKEDKTGSWLSTAYVSIRQHTCVKKEDKTGSWLWTPVWRIQRLTYADVCWRMLTYADL